MTSYAPLSPSPVSPGWDLCPGQAGLEAAAPRRGQRRPEGLPGALPLSAGLRKRARRGGQGPQQLPGCRAASARPRPAGAFPTATCSESRADDGSCSPAGTAGGCLILIAAPGDRDVFPLPYFICAPRRCRPPPTPRLPRRGERRWLRGRRHLLGSFAWPGEKIPSTVGAMSTVQVKTGLRSSRSNNVFSAWNPPGCQQAAAVRSKTDSQKSTQYVAVWICSPLPFLTW